MNLPSFDEWLEYDRIVANRERNLKRNPRILADRVGYLFQMYCEDKITYEQFIERFNNCEKLLNHPTALGAIDLKPLRIQSLFKG